MIRTYGKLVGSLGCAAFLAACSGDDTVGEAPVVDSGPDATTDGSTSPDAATEAGDAGPGLCADAGTPPSTLACTGLYSDFSSLTVSPNAVAYTPSTPLWSDGAQKQRWIELPPGTQIDRTNPSEWTFPVGTKLFKEFRVDGQRVETRMFQKAKVGFWNYATYAWSADAKSATINYGGQVPVGADGGTWTIPTNEDCNSCHAGRLDKILGFEEVSLGLPLAQGLTLANLTAQGLLTPAPTNVSLSIGDDGTGLDGIAMGWLHVNCGVTCHNVNPSATGQGAGMHLRLDPTQLNGSAPDPTTWDILDTTINVPCISGGFVGQPRIEPGNPAASVIYQLIDERGQTQMPPIASLLVDVPDVAVIHSWVTAMGQDGGTEDDAGEPVDGGHHPKDGGEFDAHFPTDSGKDSSGEGDSASDAPSDSTTDAEPDATSDAGADAAGEDASDDGG